MPWGIAGECCFASTAGEWWSRRLCELSQGWPDGPSFSAVLSAPRPGTRAGGRVPFAAPRYRRSPQPPLRGRARRLAFPRPSRVLHPRLPELGREECGAHLGRLSGHSAGRGIRRMQVERLLCVSGIWGWGLQETRLSRARCSASSCAWCSCSFSASAWRVARRWGSGAATTPIGFPETLRPSPSWNTLAGSISISNPVPSQMGGSQKVVLPNLSVSASKTSAHPSSTLSSPCVSHTTQVVSSSSLQQRSTTLGADVARERPYPRTSHLRPLDMSATLSVWVRRISSTSSRVCCDFSSNRLYLATSPERRSSSSARHRCSPRIVAVLPLVEPKHVAASLRRSPSRGSAGGVFRGSWSRARRLRGPVQFRVPLGGERSRSLCQSHGTC